MLAWFLLYFLNNFDLGETPYFLEEEEEENTVTVWKKNAQFDQSRHIAWE